MPARVPIILPSISLLMSGANIYLFKVYGSLVWWWRHLQQEGFFNGKEPPPFFVHVDQIHILAIILSILNLCCAIVLWRTKIAHSKLGVLAVIIAACVFFVCAMISV